jgi:rubredoxin
MENTEYKCLCCGWIGNDEEFGINSKNEFTELTEMVVCPHCGSMEIDILIPEIDLSV